MSDNITITIEDIYTKASRILVIVDEFSKEIMQEHLSANFYQINIEFCIEFRKHLNVIKVSNPEIAERIEYVEIDQILAENKCTTLASILKVLVRELLNLYNILKKRLKTNKMNAQLFIDLQFSLFNLVWRYLSKIKIMSESDDSDVTQYLEQFFNLT